MAKEAGAYPSGASYDVPLLRIGSWPYQQISDEPEKLPITNIRLGLEEYPGTNAVAYLSKPSTIKKKSYITFLS